jgi:hypothetical protein
MEIVYSKIRIYVKGKKMDLSGWGDVGVFRGAGILLMRIPKNYDL